MTDLDEFVRRVRHLWCWLEVRGYENTTDLVVREESVNHPSIFGRALQDPRFLNYCKEQDEKEYWTPSKGMAEYRAKWFIPINLDFTS